MLYRSQLHSGILSTKSCFCASDLVLCCCCPGAAAVVLQAGVQLADLGLQVIRGDNM
jgi:hypothetical protein